MLTATMTAVIAASTSTQITALIAHVIIKKTVLLGLLLLLLGMVSVMTGPTMLTATMMVVIAANGPDGVAGVAVQEAVAVEANLDRDLN